MLGIVCEYNPFHNGHLYHIEESKRALGGEPVICVMSGDFVQRGEAAAFSKYARAEAACRCGADLVVELPLPWCIASAEGFARGAVGLLSALGATHLSFGSEAGETEPLVTVARTLSESSFIDIVKDIMKRDAAPSFAAARELALRQELGELSELIRTPNNILGVEYIKAIYELKTDLQPMTVKRLGVAHDARGEGSIRSASELRMMVRNNEDISACVPPAAWSVYERELAHGRLVSMESLETALLSRLRMLPPSAFDALPDAADGLGRRLAAACAEEATVDAVIAAVKTKRYAHARIRRMLLAAALGVSADMNSETPPYARVLAANDTGFAVLKAARERIPVISKPASVRTLPSNCTDVFALNSSAHDLFTLGYGVRSERKGEMDWKTSPFIVKNV